MEIDPKTKVSKRRAAGKSDSDVKQTAYPIVTQTAYESLCRGQNVDGYNLKMKQLCVARNKLGVTMVNIDSAIHGWNPQIEQQNSAVFQRLRAIRDKLEKELLRFPLEVQK